MINVLFYCTTHPGREADMRALLHRMIQVSREQDGAIQYTFLQHAEDPDEWALVEQWRDRAHLEAHVANMKRHFGEPPPGASLPAEMHALVRKSSFAFYRGVD